MKNDLLPVRPDVQELLDRVELFMSENDTLELPDDLAEEMESLILNNENELEGIYNVLERHKSRTEMYKVQMKRFKAMIDTMAATDKWLKNNKLQNIVKNIGSVSGKAANLSYKTNSGIKFTNVNASKVHITDEELVPDMFMSMTAKITPEDEKQRKRIVKFFEKEGITYTKTIDKKALNAAMKLLADNDEETATTDYATIQREFSYVKISDGRPKSGN